MPPTILVTGGAGFIGSCFVRQVVGERAARVVDLDLLTYAGNLDSLGAALDDPLHVFVRGDIADAVLVGELLRTHRPAAVVHFAAESHVDRSIDGPRAFLQTNVVGTFELLVAARAYWEALDVEARRAFRFLHVSTDEVYGSLSPTEAFTEETAYDPHSPYSASKAASDHFVRAFHHTYGLPTLVTNCSNNYGPYQFPEKLIPLTGAPGILERPGDASTLVSYTDLAGLEQLREQGCLIAGMLPKASAIQAAIRGGVRRVHILSHSLRDGLLAEVFTNEGVGTLVVEDLNALTPDEQSAGKGVETETVGART